MTRISADTAASLVQPVPPKDGGQDTTGFAELQKAMDAIVELNEQGELFNEPPVEISEVDPEEEETQHFGSDEDEEEPEAEEEVVAQEDENKKQQRERQTLREEKRKRYAVIQEKREIEARVAAAEERTRQLEELLSQTTQTATYHFKNKLYADLDRAKENKSLALEGGDGRAVVEADIALTNAINAVKELEKVTANNNYQANNYTDNYYQQPTPPQYNNNHSHLDQQQHSLQTELVEDWLESHPYLQPNSKHYNRSLAQNVGAFVQHLDTELVRRGQSHQHYTDNYFNAIDTFIASNRNTNVSRPANSYVGGVKNSYSPSSPTRSLRTPLTPKDLSPEEKIMLQNMPGVNMDDYLKIKLENMKKDNKRR